MEENNSAENSLAYQRDVMEFVTVAVQYCAFLEDLEGRSRNQFVDMAVKLLPLLYIKGVLLPDLEPDESVSLQDTVTAENYDIVRSNIALTMGHYDDFLEVFVEDMAYSDTPVLATVSEYMADIYQDIKNFAAVYRDSVTEVRMEALAECKDNFKHYWGQKLTCVLRALHDIRYNQKDEEDDYAADL